MQAKQRYQYLFGPVPSRRFGRSLGIDLVHFKTCSLNCVFCQLGPTPETTLQIEEYVPVDDVLNELHTWLSSEAKADFLTLSGSGEPTLHSRFQEVLQFIHENCSIPALLLTNGTLLQFPPVREAAAWAHVVKSSLSAWDQKSFEIINRPDPGLDFELCLKGQEKFRQEYSGTLFLEVFVIKGINDDPGCIRRIANLAGRIEPDRIQLNTAVRPPAEGFVQPVSRKDLEEIALEFTPQAEIIAEFKQEREEDGEDFQANENLVLSMLERRPCTVQDLAGTTGLHVNEISKYIGKYLRRGEIKTIARNQEIYYMKQNIE